MSSFFCERAIETSIRYGNALLKFISPNDVGLTGGHQCGFYLPKLVYQMFTPYPPTRGENNKHRVTIEWQDDRVTESVVTWYGKRTRREYRLTRFGKDFPFLAGDTVGSLLVLIPRTAVEFTAYVLDLDEDIEEIQAALGVDIGESWAIYQNGAPRVEDEDECIDRLFRRFVATLTEFPPGIVFSETARAILRECVERFKNASADVALTMSMDAEYQLFRLAERQLCQPDIVRPFRNVDDFLNTAATIMQRRKSRAGRSLENHVETVLKEANIPHEMRPNIDGKPDVVIPNRAAYYDPSYPTKNLIIVGVKRTCKDRWRQVLNEGERVREKHILTLQPGISGNQLDEMHKAKVTLIVPKKFHKDYPTGHAITLLNIEEFITAVRTRLAR